jgi:hypothetical protein
MMLKEETFGPVEFYTQKEQSIENDQQMVNMFVK